MEGTKLIKAFCEKTGQYFALEVKKYGAKWKVVNVTHLSKDEARIVSSEIEQSSFETNENLLPCLKCGTRKVGGCSCSKKNRQCGAGMKYQFDCIYCDRLKVDYSLPSASELGRRAGDKVILSQGQEVQIRCGEDKKLSKIIVGVGWDPAKGAHSMDVDSSVVVMSANNRGKELVYFGDKEHTSGCVIHHGDNLTGEGTNNDDDENISVYLDKVPANRDKLVFVLNIYDCVKRKQTLGLVENLYIRLYDPDSKKALVEYTVSGNMLNDTAIIIGMAFKKNGGWSFKAIGKGMRVADVRELAEKCGSLV